MLVNSPGKYAAIAALLAVIGALAALAAYNRVFAAPGDLDPTFGGLPDGPRPGQVQTHFADPQEDRAVSVAVQSGTGKIVVLGTHYEAPLALWNVARYTPDGRLDHTFFGSRGYRRIGLGNNSIARAVAIQPDGKIVMVGSSQGVTNTDSALVRLTADGEADSSFGNNGVLISQLSASYDDALTTVLIQPDGKILVGGYVGSNTGYDFLLARYLTNGTLDPTFGTGGVSGLRFTDDDDYVAAIMLQGSSIIAAGSANGHFGLTRFDASGKFDSTFGIGGTQITDFGGPSGINALLPQPGGQIVAAGTAQVGALGGSFALARYDADGRLNGTFGILGKTTTDFAADSADAAYALLAQSGGKLIAVGAKTSLGGTPSSGDFALARYSANGVLDSTFGTNGLQTASFGEYDAALAATLLDGNKILAVGEATVRHDGAATGDRDFGLARFNADGATDTTFGTDGKTTSDFAQGRDSAADMVRQPDGKLIVVGSTYNYPNADFAVARYTVTGTLDSGFSLDGRIVTSFTLPLVSPATASAAGVVLQPDGKIVVGGEASGAVALVRYLPNGNLDAGFGSSGKATTSLLLGGVSDIALAGGATGKILVLGYTQVNEQSRIVLGRFLPNGTLDTAFGTNGFVVQAIGDYAEAAALAVQSDGKIVVAGATGSNNEDFALLRYNPNGTLDTSFGGSGIVSTDLGASEYANGVTLLAGGKILLVGFSASGPEAKASGSSTSLALARYNADGTLDTSFGTGGKLRYAPPGQRMTGVEAVALPDGRLVVGGYTDADWALVLFKDDGTLSNSFGTNGLVTTHFVGADEGIAALALESDGKIVAAGWTSTEIGTPRFGLARFLAPGADSLTTPTPCGISFSDVHSGDYFAEPVQYLACRGVISGYDDGSFRPFANATRGQLAKIVVGAVGWQLVDPPTATFKDVPPTSPFFRQIETAVQHGVISGYDDPARCGAGQTPCFKPNDNVTRGQLSKIVVGAANWPPANPTTPTFDDVSSANPFYREIETAVIHGIISGYELPNGHREFHWGAQATRGQISKIVYLAVTGAIK